MNQKNTAVCRKVKQSVDVFKIFNVDVESRIMRARVANGAAIIESGPKICKVGGRNGRSVNIITFQNLHLLSMPL